MLQPSVRTTLQVMNWIVLVLAGLCECGFAFCLGKANMATFWRLLFTFTLITSIIGLKVVQ